MEAGRNDLMSLFIKLNKLRFAMMFTEMKSLGLTGPQMFLLRELFLGQPKTIGDLSKTLELSNSTVTGLLDRLERDGLVERKRDEKDRRVIWISTTEICQRVKKERFDLMQQEITAELMKSFSPDQFDLLRIMLEKLIEYLEKKLEGNS